MSRLIVVAVYVAIVAALVAVSQVMVSDELTAERLAEEAEREHYASIGSEPVFVFAVDGVDVFPSVGDAAESLEGFDIDNGEFEVLITLDGRIVRAESRGEVAVLTVTQQREVAELKRRLRSFARSAGFLCTPDDPRAVANEILRRQWETRWPKRPRWLDERIHGSNPDQI